MLGRLCEWASYNTNLKQYYAYYAAFYTLDGVATSLAAILLWLYVPMTRFLLLAWCNAVPDAIVYIGDAYLGLHPVALADARRQLDEMLNIDMLGNTLITVVTGIGLLRAYMGYRIYMRGSREANEKV